MSTTYTGASAPAVQSLHTCDTHYGSDAAQLNSVARAGMILAPRRCMTTSIAPLRALEQRIAGIEIDPAIAPAVAAIALGVTAGCRSMTGVAAVSRAARNRARNARDGGDALDQPARMLASQTAVRLTAAAAAMEIGGDKLPSAPNRTDAIPLLGRVLCGALVGATVAALTKRPRGQYVLLGAGAAFLGAELGLRVRRALTEMTAPLPAGAIEDAIVMGIASLGVAALNEDR